MIFTIKIPKTILRFSPTLVVGILIEYNSYMVIEEMLAFTTVRGLTVA